MIKSLFSILIVSFTAMVGALSALHIYGLIFGDKKPFEIAIVNTKEAPVKEAKA